MLLLLPRFLISTFSFHSSLIFVHLRPLVVYCCCCLFVCLGFLFFIILLSYDCTWNWHHNFPSHYCTWNWRHNLPSYYCTWNWRHNFPSYCCTWNWRHHLPCKAKPTSEEKKKDQESSKVMDAGSCVEKPRNTNWLENHTKRVLLCVFFVVVFFLFSVSNSDSSFICELINILLTSRQSMTDISD